MMTKPAFAISLIEPLSPPYPTVRKSPIVAGDWQYREQLSTLFVPITARASFCIRYASSLVHLEEAMKPMESGPWVFFNSISLVPIRSSASSQVALRNRSPSRISGAVSRSLSFTKSQPNLPLTQVEIPLVGPSSGSTFRMWRSLDQTSKLQPTPQYVQTVLARGIADSRISSSPSETLKIEPYPISGSMLFTKSIIPLS